VQKFAHTLLKYQQKPPGLDFYSHPVVLLLFNNISKPFFVILLLLLIVQHAFYSAHVLRKHLSVMAMIWTWFTVNPDWQAFCNQHIIQ